jgi:hypothetical protein
MSSDERDKENPYAPPTAAVEVGPVGPDGQPVAPWPAGVRRRRVAFRTLGVLGLVAAPVLLVCVLIGLVVLVRRIVELRKGLPVQVGGTYAARNLIALGTLLALGLLGTVSGWGFFRLRAWGWWLAVVFFGAAVGVTAAWDLFVFLAPPELVGPIIPQSVIVFSSMLYLCDLLSLVLLGTPSGRRAFQTRDEQPPGPPGALNQAIGLVQGGVLLSGTLASSISWIAVVLHTTSVLTGSPW